MHRVALLLPALAAVMASGPVAVADTYAAVGCAVAGVVESGGATSGVITGGPFVVDDITTPIVTIHCSVQTTRTPGTGVIFSTSQTTPGMAGLLVAPVNFVRGDNQPVYLCSTIEWHDAGGSYSVVIDSEPQTSGTQCQLLQLHSTVRAGISGFVAGSDPVSDAG